MTNAKVLYTAKTHTTGGREHGASRSSDGHLDIKLSTPGTAGAGTNPEQLFAAGWSACFEGAMGLVARKMKITLPADLAIDAEVDLNLSDAGFFLGARLNVSLPGLEPEVAKALVNAAHQTCPYSKLTRNNIDVAINLVLDGAIIGRRRLSGKPSRSARCLVAGGVQIATSSRIEWTARTSCAPLLTCIKERTMTTAAETPKARGIDMKLEVVVIPVSDIDRTKRFYGNLGWRLDADFATGDFRVIQFTPPGSASSIHFGTARPGVGSAVPGSAQGLYLIVSDVEAARAELVGRGVDVSEVFHRAGRDEPLQRPGSGAEQLRFARHVQGSGRQRLAAAGGHRAIARTRGRFRHDLHLVDRDSSPRSGVRRQHMASTRSAPASTMRTGRTGTPTTSSGSRPASRCRHERRPSCRRRSDHYVNRDSGEPSCASLAPLSVLP